MYDEDEEKENEVNGGENRIGINSLLEEKNPNDRKESVVEEEKIPIDRNKEKEESEIELREIEDERIAGAIFDMHVMSGSGSVSKTIQNSLNEEGYSVKVDGLFGSETIKALNRIEKDGKVNQFMKTLKENRKNALGSYKKVDDYPGWGSRTERY